MKKNKIIVIVAVTILILTLTSGFVLAYFTVWCAAKGQIYVKGGEAKVIINSQSSGSSKKISIQNTGDYPCAIRLKVFNAENKDVIINNSTKWQKNEDNYWYYSEILYEGKSTNALNLQGKNNVVICESTQDISIVDGVLQSDWLKTYESGI